jgi:hypothetical protein
MCYLYFKEPSTLAVMMNIIKARGYMINIDVMNGCVKMLIQTPDNIAAFNIIMDTTVATPELLNEVHYNVSLDIKSFYEAVNITDNTDVLKMNMDNIRVNRYLDGTPVTVPCEIIDRSSNIEASFDMIGFNADGPPFAIHPILYTTTITISTSTLSKKLKRFLKLQRNLRFVISQGFIKVVACNSKLASTGVCNLSVNIDIGEESGASINRMDEMESTTFVLSYNYLETIIKLSDFADTMVLYHSQTEPILFEFFSSSVGSIQMHIVPMY